MSGRIAITTTSFAENDTTPLSLLERAGFEPLLNTLGRALVAGEPADICAGCAGIVAGTERYDAETLETLAAAGLRAISRVGVGMDAIDHDAAARLGIAIRNTPNGPTDAVAELAIALMFDLLRHVSRMDRDLRAGTWKKRTGRLFASKRVGIIGFGRIGRRVSDLALALGAEVSFTDVCEIDDVPACTLLGSDDLLGWADIITLHCSKTGDGTPLIGERELARMRDGAYLVNTSRGGLVDEGAVAAALASGKLAGAALDVFGAEPYSGPLTGLENVVLTPHVGSYAMESRVEMEIDAVKNLLEELAR